MTILEDWGGLSWFTKWALQNKMFLTPQTRLCIIIDK